MAKGPKQKASSIWDRPPFPQRGDADKKEIWTAVGAAISAWGEYEGALGRLFTIFIAGEFPSPQAKKAFGAIRSFEGRRDLLRGASEAFFHYRKGTSEEQSCLKEIMRDAAHAVERRNDLAHGILRHRLNLEILSSPVFDNLEDLFRNGSSKPIIWLIEIRANDSHHRLDHFWRDFNLFRGRASRDRVAGCGKASLRIGSLFVKCIVAASLPSAAVPQR